MTRELCTFRPRDSASTCCAVCDERLEASGSGARCDPILGRYMCARHGLASTRYATKRLLDLAPRLALLLRSRREFSWLRMVLHPSLARRVVLFRSKHSRRARPTPRTGRCAFCEKTVGADGSRRDVRPWCGSDYCRACHSRTSRAAARSASQLKALACFVREGGGEWVLALLRPLVNERIAKMLACRREALDPNRYL